MTSKKRPFLPLCITRIPLLLMTHEEALLVLILKTRHNSFARMIGAQFFRYQRNRLATAHPLRHEFLYTLNGFLLLFMGE